jgi:hypothetical protein
MDRLLAFAAPTAPAYVWHDLYLEALFETDRAKIPMRIREAERALINREHELYASPQSTAERELLVTALYGLRALRVCLCPESSTAAAA